MNLDSVIKQLKTFCEPLDGRVAGAADYAKGIENTANMKLPCGFVIPVESIGSDWLEEGGGMYQILTETIAVIVIFDNSADRRGQNSVDQVEAMRLAIMACIYNWPVDPTRMYRGLKIGKDALIDFDRARLFYQWEFVGEFQFDSDDGWHPDMVPLTEIDFTNTGNSGVAGSTLQSSLQG